VPSHHWRVQLQELIQSMPFKYVILLSIVMGSLLLIISDVAAPTDQFTHHKANGLHLCRSSLRFFRK
jgi:hypothetical protein